MALIKRYLSPINLMLDSSSSAGSTSQPEGAGLASLGTPEMIALFKNAKPAEGALLGLPDGSYFSLNELVQLYLPGSQCLTLGFDHSEANVVLPPSRGIGESPLQSLYAEVLTLYNVTQQESIASFVS